MRFDIMATCEINLILFDIFDINLLVYRAKCFCIGIDGVMMIHDFDNDQRFTTLLLTNGHLHNMLIYEINGVTFSPLNKATYSEDDC